MTAHTLRLDLILRRYPLDDRSKWPEGAYGDMWTWRLWSGSRIVSSSGSQRYSRRIDCARGAEVGTGFESVPYAAKHGGGWVHRMKRAGHYEEAVVRVLDERQP